MNVALLLSVLSAAIAGCEAQRVVNVANSQQLIAAVVDVRAGDEIVIASGSYFSPLHPTSFRDDAFITSYASGTEDQRITLRGANKDFPPVIFGTEIIFWSVIRLLNGANWWVIEDLILNVAQVGIMIDASDNTEIRRVQVRRTGQEGIHIRSGAKNTLIEDCKISETGQDNAGFGEAIYIGSDRSHHNFYAADVGNTVIRNNVIGPFVRGEPFDIKEGTFDTIIENNTVNAEGLSGQNFADSFVDIKGSRTFVRFNTFNRQGAAALNKGIAIIDRNTPNSAFENVIHGNTFNFDDDGSNMPIVSAGGRTTDTYMYDNIRIPAEGGQSSGNVNTTCCPSFYAVPDVCFSGDMQVQEERKGTILMRELQLGDRVLVGESRFERVYSFGHKDKHQKTSFLQFLPSNLELSKDHMVMVSGKGPIPASMVEVGDRFVGGERVQAVRFVPGTGVYAPFTASGTIVVNGVLASTYVAFQGSNKLVLGSFEAPITYQWIAHTFLAPYRIWCEIFGATGSSKGISKWVEQPLRGLQGLLEHHPFVVGLTLLPMLLLLALFSVLEAMLLSPMAGIVVVATLVLSMRRRMTGKSLK